MEISARRTKEEVEELDRNDEGTSEDYGRGLIWKILLVVTQPTDNLNVPWSRSTSLMISRPLKSFLCFGCLFEFFSAGFLLFLFFRDQLKMLCKFEMVCKLWRVLALKRHLLTNACLFGPIEISEVKDISEHSEWCSYKRLRADWRTHHCPRLWIANKNTNIFWFPGGRVRVVPENAFDCSYYQFFDLLVIVLSLCYERFNLVGISH